MARRIPNTLLPAGTPRFKLNGFIAPNDLCEYWLAIGESDPERMRKEMEDYILRCRKAGLVMKSPFGDDVE